MQDITVQELKHRLDAGENIHILDVREPDEYVAYNIGAKLLPLGQVMSMQIDELEDWKDDEIVVHCHAGKRSMQAAMMLETAGFTNVKNLAGGMVAWRELTGQ
jgi:rhodanese-related sulfurtransferase